MSGRSTIYQCDGACECERGNGKSGLQGTKGFIIVVVVVVVVVAITIRGRFTIVLSVSSAAAPASASVSMVVQW